MKKISPFITRPLISFMLACFVVLASAGCYKDKGNYNYSELGDFYIDQTGMTTNYTVKMLTQIQIEPKVVYYGNPENLSYNWKLYPTSTSLFEANAGDNISTDKILSKVITATPRSYYLEFRAIETETKRFVSFLYNLRVESTGSGIEVLYQRDGLTDFGLITPLFMFGTAEQDEVSLDIYTSVNPDYPLTGNPVGLGNHKTTATDVIFLYTENDGVCLSPFDYSIIEHFSARFAVPPDPPKIQAYKCPIQRNNPERAYGWEVLVNDGILYMRSQTSATETIFGPYSFEDGYNYYAAPFPLVSNGGGVVMFDMISTRLLTAGVSGSVLAVPRNDLGDPLNKDLVYMDGLPLDRINMILKDKTTDNQNNRYYYIADVFSNYTYLHKWDISAYTGIAQAELFAFSYRANTGYYVANNTIYLIKYDMIGNAIQDQAIEMWQATAGETITAILLCPHPGRDLGGNDARDRYLFVGTYNESTKDGKVYTFEVNLETDGTFIQTPVAVYGGFGKIKGFSFKF